MSKLPKESPLRTQGLDGEVYGKKPKKKIQVKHCEECNGKGAFEVCTCGNVNCPSSTKCETCNGTGHVVI